MAELPEGVIISHINELIHLNGIAPTHTRVLTSMRAVYVTNYITRFRAVHPHTFIPEGILQLASPEDLRSPHIQPIPPPETNSLDELAHEGNSTIDPHSPGATNGDEGNTGTQNEHAPSVQGSHLSGGNMDQQHEETQLGNESHDGPQSEHPWREKSRAGSLTSRDADGEQDSDENSEKSHQVRRNPKRSQNKPLFVPDSDSEDEPPVQLSKFRNQPRLPSANKKAFLPDLDSEDESAVQLTEIGLVSSPRQHEQSTSPETQSIGLKRARSIDDGGSIRSYTRHRKDSSPQPNSSGGQDCISLSDGSQHASTGPDPNDANNSLSSTEFPGNQESTTAIEVHSKPEQHPPPRKGVCTVAFGVIRLPREGTTLDEEEEEEQTINNSETNLAPVPIPNSQTQSQNTTPNQSSSTTLGQPARIPPSLPNSKSTNPQHTTPNQSPQQSTSQAARQPSPDLFVRLKSDELKRLDYWSEVRDVRVDPQKTSRLLGNTQYIIGQLPALLGYKKPGMVPIKSPMLKNVSLCIKRCKDAQILGGQDDDCFIGNQFINRACLAPRPRQATSKTMTLRSTVEAPPEPDHPLYQVINFTSHPVRGALKRLTETVKDICGLLAQQRASKVMDDLQGMDGHSDAALMKVNEFFLDLSTAVSEDIGDLDESTSSGMPGRPKPPRPSQASTPTESDAAPSGIRGIISHLALAVTALLGMHIEKKNDQRHLHLTKDAYEKMNRTSTKALRSLAYLLVIGPLAMFSCPTDRKTSPQWQSSMLTEWGAVVVAARARDSSSFPNPPWSHFGNTRLHIIKTLGKMGFGVSEPLNWTHVMRVFVDDFSQRRMAEVLWEDIALITDYDVQNGAEVIWAEEKNARNSGGSS